MFKKQEAIFRSADISLIEMYIPQEISRDVAYTLGSTGLVQFIDLNEKVKSFQRTFISEIRKLDNIERQYRYFSELLRIYQIPLPSTSDNNIDSDRNNISHITASSSTIDDHIENASILEKRLIQLVDANDQLELQKSELEEFRAILQVCDDFFSRSNVDTQNLVSNMSQYVHCGTEELTQRSVCFTVGVIPRIKVNVLERIIWRVVRGNLYFKHIELDEPIYDVKSKKNVYKDAFIVFSHGELILQRIKKIAESLDATLYNVDEGQEIRSQQLLKVNNRLQDLYTVLETTVTTLETELYAISKELNKWSEDIYKEKAVYGVLNMFVYDSSGKTLIAEGWIPDDELENLQIQLYNLTTRMGIEASSIVNVVKTNRTPPTFHRTNKFTKAFQDICDCYGIAFYQEVNPGLPTIITFPFMFAIMFGDMGHGFLMFLVAFVLVYNEKAIGKMKRDEIFDMAFSGRYIVLLMGLFSIYTGLLYNDIFSKSLTLFKSGWEWPEYWEAGQVISAKQVGVYPIGIDFSWHNTENALLFSNSLKMKLSIIMGFIHMLYSYSFSLINALYFNDMVDIFCNFIPGLLFLSSIFGYLVICIIYKWSKDWVADGKPAPGLLNTLINMFLSPGTVDEELYPGQATVQVALILLALVCIPWLLLAKPLHFRYMKKAHQHQKLAGSENEEVEIHIDQLYELDDCDANEHDSHDENMGDVVIHQVIHTIEWCLNCVSHTASYLRLWALSLAHAQLSTVLWTMTIEISFGFSGLIGVFMVVILFAVWFVLTCVILVVMEGTSAMLHSLRLHWVESMSKFFRGEGHLYQPFKFNYLGLVEDSS